MKISHLFILGFVALPLLSAKAQVGLRQISVSGSAEVKVTPDEVDLNVTVETRNANLDQAKRDNDDRIAGALRFLKQNGVKEKDIQTDYLSIQPIFDSREKLAVTPGLYQVRKGIGIRLLDVGNFDTIFTGLINNGVNYVLGIEFRTSELRKYKDQARVMAVRAAKEKAEAMAAELGVKVGLPTNISVNEWSSSMSRQGGMNQNASQDAARSSGEGGESFSAGQISVSATVNVSFVLE
jgi:uncharacterized protein YggE